MEDRNVNSQCKKSMQDKDGYTHLNVSSLEVRLAIRVGFVALGFGSVLCRPDSDPFIFVLGSCRVSCRPISAKYVQRVFFRFSNTVFSYGFRIWFLSMVFVINISNSLFVSNFQYYFLNIFVQYFVIYT